jgi:uncharacterized protein (TIGR00730 family)
LKRVGVFCGSSSGARPDYTHAAVELGAALVERGIGLVYGGGRIGLMGRIAESVVSAGGEVIGVIPEALSGKELAFEELADLRVVASMSERKAVMAELSDGFVALPGGYGTLDELVEMLTWTQLRIHNKPCGLLNTQHYYDGLLGFFDRSVSDNFLQREHRSMLLVETEPATLLDRLESWTPPVIDKTKWILGLEDV